MPLFPKGCNAFNAEITSLSVRAQFQRTESTPTSSSRKGFTVDILRGLSSHWEGKSKLKTRLSGTTHKATLQIVSHWENCYLSWHQEISTFTTVPPLEQSETKFSPHISHSQILKKNERPRSHRHPCLDNVSCTRADPELLTNLDTDYTGVKWCMWSKELQPKEVMFIWHKHGEGVCRGWGCARYVSSFLWGEQFSCCQ